MSGLVSTVPAAVPSDAQSVVGENHVPWAQKKTRLPTAARPVGLLPSLPARMSETMAVPPTVPSLRHSSEPCTPSVAVKKTKEPAATRLPTCERLASLLVPAAVPSLLHSPSPLA